MKKTIIITLIILAAGLIWWNVSSKGTSSVQTPDTTGETSPFDQSISDNIITLIFPSDQFGLAVNQPQILANSYIPPCDPDFDYCLYYKAGEYTSTNFDSAGLRIKKRTDITNEKLCLETPPDGYDASTKPEETKSGDSYISSVFKNLSDAGAGHFANGSLYRLFVRDSSTCYELETRIGQTQLQNYPEGTIKEFTATDMRKVDAMLKKIVSEISLPSGEKGLFP